MDKKSLLRSLTYCNEPRLFIESHLLLEQKCDFMNIDTFVKSYWFKAASAFAKDMFDIMEDSSLYPSVDIKDILAGEAALNATDSDDDDDDSADKKKKKNSTAKRFYTTAVENWETYWEDEIDDLRYAISLVEDIIPVNYPSSVKTELYNLLTKPKGSLRTIEAELKKVKSGNLSSVGRGDKFAFGYYRGIALTLLSDAMEILCVPWDYVWPYYTAGSNKVNREFEYYKTLGLVGYDKDGKLKKIHTNHGQDLERAMAQDLAAEKTLKESKNIYPRRFHKGRALIVETKESKTFRNAYLSALLLEESKKRKAFEELKSKNPDLFRCFDRYFRH